MTPGARIWVTELGRFMVPMEKILIHMIPVHDLDWPSDLSDNDIMDLGGNTMHAMAAGALVFLFPMCPWRAASPCNLLRSVYIDSG